jgi:hypothetical protein
VGCTAAGATVQFDPSLAGQTIVLTGTEIAITQPITIDGSGAPGIIVDAGNKSRVFNIGASGTVTLTALVLQNGRAASGHGGAVLAGASPLVLNQVQVLSSTVVAGTGGGLFADGPLTHTGTDFISNTSFGGGGATVIAALMHVVGEDGTLVMSAYPVSPAVPLTGAEVARGITWKVRRLEPGSLEKTGMGRVADECSRRPDVVCGEGLHRVCAWGPPSPLAQRWLPASAGSRWLGAIDESRHRPLFKPAPGRADRLPARDRPPLPGGVDCWKRRATWQRMY